MINLEFRCEGLAKNARPQMPSPSFSVFSSVTLLIEHQLYASTNGGERVLQYGHLVVSGHVLARQFELFLRKQQALISALS
jgi:hypothetical protein